MLQLKLNDVNSHFLSKLLKVFKQKMTIFTSKKAMSYELKFKLHKINFFHQ